MTPRYSGWRTSRAGQIDVSTPVVPATPASTDNSGSAWEFLGILFLGAVAFETVSYLWNENKQRYLPRSR